MMQQHSPPASPKDVKILLSLLNKNHVDYVLIGGYPEIRHLSSR